ncbi:MAG: putative ArCR [Firmicutes bacterium]|nr:putative ArCR [Bacillota bacterium]
MKSELAIRLKLRYSPVAILFTNVKPDHALEFAEKKWGCVAAMLTAATKGKTIVFSRETFGCLGGGIGLGFGNLYPQFPGGFANFLSTGRGEGYPAGEAYKKTPEFAQCFADSLPIKDIAQKYVVFQPLSDVAQDDDGLKIIVFYVNPDQLSALVVLANYGRPTNDNVIIPFAAGCQTACLIPCDESSQEKPRAVVGMTDISARPVIDADLLSFSVPFSLFKEMEGNIPGSFLDKEAWQKVAKRIPGVPFQ